MKCFSIMAIVLLSIFAIPLTAFAASLNDSGNSGSSTIYTVVVIVIAVAIRIIVSIARRSYRYQGKKDTTQSTNPQTPTLSVSNQQNIEKDPVMQNNTAASANLEKLKNTNPIEYKRSVVAHAAGFKDFASMVSSDPTLDRSLAFATSEKDLNKVAIAYGYPSFKAMFQSSLEKQQH